MGFWYLLILILGILLLAGWISDYKKNKKNKMALIISVGLIAFALFMFSPLSIKLVDALF